MGVRASTVPPIRVRQRRVAPRKRGSDNPQPWVLLDPPMSCILWTPDVFQQRRPRSQPGQCCRGRCGNPSTWRSSPQRVFLLMGADLGSPHKSALAFGGQPFLPVLVAKAAFRPPEANLSDFSSQSQLEGNYNSRQPGDA